MIFSSLYRLSFYVMLTLATLALSVDASDNKIAMLYPPVVAVAGVLAFLTVDRNPRLGLSRGLANILALACVTLSYLEFRFDENLLLLALTHWLVYLQLIKMFLPKTVEDDWFLFMLGLTQVLAAVVMSQSDIVGAVLFGWVLSALWVLSLFSLHRESLRAALGASPPATREGGTLDPYPGLFNLAFVFTTLRVAATAVALGGLMFLIMPRSASMGSIQTGPVPSRHLTGFDDQVRLGQMGEILENTNLVMTIEFYDRDEERIEPRGEPLFRGTTMLIYEEGRWHRQAKRFGDFPAPPGPLEAPRTIVQRIKLEPQDGPTLFGLRPMLKAHSSRRPQPVLNPRDGSLYRDNSRSRRGTYDYEVKSNADTSRPQPGEQFPDVDRLDLLLGVAQPLKSRLARIARPIVEGIPADDWPARARALETYLRDPGRFSYTLRMDVIDRGIDPVEDFLVNRKEGHCEYFASALTLMLRSIGIPARMVNGFKGGDWNALARIMSVRELHAHSWVEVLVGGDEFRGPEWITLDPTPAQGRAESVARVGGFSSRFRAATDFIRYVWTFYVVGFNADRQKKLIYDPFRALVKEAKRGFSEMGQALSSAARRVLDFPSFASLISVRGFLVTFIALSLAAGLVRGLAWLARRVWRSSRWAHQGDSGRTAGVIFYRRLTILLAEFGMERPAGETHREFAERANVFLSGRGPSTVTVAEVPSTIVDAFYRVRFGQREVTPAALRVLEQSLDALESGLRARHV